MTKKREFKWEVRKTTTGPDKGKWGIFLIQEYCKTDEPVCYGVSRNKKTAQASVKRMNDPSYWSDDE
jgi:hypothetical protein